MLWSYLVGSGPKGMCSDEQVWKIAGEMIGFTGESGPRQFAMPPSAGPRYTCFGREGGCLLLMRGVS